MIKDHPSATERGFATQQIETRKDGTWGRETMGAKYQSTIGIDYSSYLLSSTHHQGPSTIHKHTIQLRTHPALFFPYSPSLRREARNPSPYSKRKTLSSIIISPSSSPLFISGQIKSNRYSESQIRQPIQPNKQSDNARDARSFQPPMKTMPSILYICNSNVDQTFVCAFMLQMYESTPL